MDILSNIGRHRTSAALALAGVACMALPAAHAHEGMADLVESLTPSVVSITVTSEVQRPSGSDFPFFDEQSPFSQLPPDSPFRRFFEERMPGDGGPGSSRPRLATGSGFIISPDGYIVTNHHVIEDATEVLIELKDGTEFEARIIGMDPKTDTALLKIDHDEDLPVVEFGDSDEVRVGDAVLAIGNPHGLGFSVSAGVISARDRMLDGAYDDYLQTDAAINFGNSGGPLFNLEGEVIGVNTAILGNGRRSSGGSIGIAFSMASNVTSKVVDQLREYGTTRRGWLGVGVQPLTEELSAAWGLDDTDGVLIANVFEGPALEAGVRRGDLIAGFDGTQIDDVSEFVRLVGDSPVGSTVQLEIVREGETLILPVTLGRREDAEESIMPAALDREPETSSMLSGMELVEITDEVREQHDLPAEARGLYVVKVEQDSAADKANIREGDVIMTVGPNAVTTLDDFTVAIAELGETRRYLPLLIDRGGSALYVPLERPS